MATLMLEEGGTDLEIEYTSVREYREDGSCKGEDGRIFGWLCSSHGK